MMDAAEMIAELDFRPPKIVKRRLTCTKLEERTLDAALQKPLVQRFLSANTISLLVGESGSGKTFLALHIAFCVSTGMDFLGLKVQKGPVLYIASEAGGYIVVRLEAGVIGHSIKEASFFYVPSSVNLLSNQSDVDEIIEIAREIEKRVGKKLAATFIDTLNRAMGGGDENSSVDMGRFIQSIERLRAELGCHVMVVHHCGKDVAKGARGHSSLKAAVDTEITVTHGRIKVTKQRDMPLGEPMGFKLEPIEVGIDADGEPVTSCVVRASEVERQESKSSERSLQALEVLKSLATKDGAKVSVDTWKQAFGHKHYSGMTRQAAWKGFSKAAEELQAKRLVMVDNQGAWVVNRQPEVNF